MSAVDRQTLRASTLIQRDGLSPDDRQVKSAAAASRLLSLDGIQKAEVLFVYMHFRSEVQTLEFIHACLQNNKVVAVPLTLPETSQLMAVQLTDPEKDVEPGYCLIPEPKSDIVQRSELDPGRIDVAIVPGAVFDRKGGRLGYGGGYYDRFLVEAAPNALRVGLAYDLQLTEEVPMEQHDQFMDFIVTEENIFDCRGV